MNAKPLNHAELLEFRDCWIHQPSCTFAASIEELMTRDAQLHDAIKRGQVDTRASWQIAEDEAVQQVARLVTKKLAPLLEAKVIPSPETPNDLASASEGPRGSLHDLVRARDVGLTSRERRAAVRRGELRASKVGREYMATRADYDSYIAAKRVTPSERRARTNIDPASAAVERALASGKLRAIPRRRKR